MPQRVLVVADQRVHVAAPNAINEEAGGHMELLIRDSGHAHVGDETPGTGPGKLSVGVTAFQALDPGVQPGLIIVNERQGLSRVTLAGIRSWNNVSRILGKERQPIVQAPLVEQSRFLKKERLHFAL